MSRPPLPGGPYLVVGLARSGQAAAWMLSDHGEVIGVDSGEAEISVIDGFEMHLGTDGVELLGWSETKIILRFWIVASAFAAIGFTIYRASV